MQADRRRLNAPAGGTAPAVFTFAGNEGLRQRPVRSRQPDEHRKVFLRTGVVPSASGSAYYEVPPSVLTDGNGSLVPDSSNLKITCTVHGPRPLPRNAAFSPNLLLSTHVKFAPFATRRRRGYVRDSSERDLSVHLETALRGVIIGDRWPKSGCEVVITVLEGEEDVWWGEAQQSGESSGGWGMMSTLAGCITVASAALVDAGIDCVDMISGGVAALARDPGSKAEQLFLDPSPLEHNIKAACAVGYLQTMDEITELWMKGDAGGETEVLTDQAVRAAILARTVLVDAVGEGHELNLKANPPSLDGAAGSKKGNGKDPTMSD